jgi:hypothetical protein
MSAKRSILMISPENDGGKMIAAVGGVRSERGGINRRSLLRGGLAVGALGAGLAAVSTFSAKPAFAENSPQYNWEWCSACAVIYYAGNGDNNNCCAGNTLNGLGSDQGPHIPGSTEYFLRNGASPTPSGYQADWAWCSKCGELFYKPDIDTSYCPLPISQYSPYDAHVAGSSTSYLVGITTNPGGYQTGWNYCTSCKSLFHGSGRATGHCAGNIATGTTNGGWDETITYKSHTPNSTAYFMGEA